GPGNPEDIRHTVETVKNLIGKKAILGLCMGHHLLGIALGGKAYKLKFGHHGSNHPVKDINTGRVYITSQNHNYVLEKDFNNDITITHINVNDNTVEGFRHNLYPIISMQYLPDAETGSLDANYIFDDFIKLMKK